MMKRLFMLLCLMFLPVLVGATGEIKATDTTGKTVYAVIINANSQVWTSGNSFAAITSGNAVTSAVTLTETALTGFYKGDFPTGITSAGRYSVLVYERIGGANAIGDTLIQQGIIDWTGSALASTAYLPQALAGTGGGLPMTDGSNGVKVSVGTGAGQINAASGKVPATVAAGDSVDVTTLLARLTSTRATLLDNLSNLDAAISSRLAASGYTAPANPTDYARNNVAPTWYAAGGLTSGQQTQLTAAATGSWYTAPTFPADYQQRGVAVTLPATAPSGYGGGGSGSDPFLYPFSPTTPYTNTQWGYYLKNSLPTDTTIQADVITAFNTAAPGSVTANSIYDFLKKAQTALAKAVRSLPSTQTVTGTGASKIGIVKYYPEGTVITNNTAPVGAVSLFTGTTAFDANGNSAGTNYTSP